MSGSEKIYKAHTKFKLVELENMNLKGDITMKEYQHLIGKIIIATAIIVAAIIIAGAIDRAGANIQRGLGYLGDALLR